MASTRRYPMIGRLATWSVPLVCGVLAAALLSKGEWVAAVILCLLAAMLLRLEGTLVCEVSPAGLARGVCVGGAFVGPARVIAWPAVEEIMTDWRGGRDQTLLVTTVQGRDGSTLSFTSTMGLRAYRALVAEVACRAPHARLTGLTAQLLAEMPARSAI